MTSRLSNQLASSIHLPPPRLHLLLITHPATLRRHAGCLHLHKERTVHLCFCSVCLLVLPRKSSEFSMACRFSRGFSCRLPCKKFFPPPATVANMISSSATSGCLSCSRRSPPTLFQMSRLELRRSTADIIFSPFDRVHPPPPLTRTSLVLAGSAMSAWALIPGRPIAAAPSDARGTETSLRVCVYFRC